MSLRIRNYTSLYEAETGREVIREKDRDGEREGRRKTAKRERRREKGRLKRHIRSIYFPGSLLSSCPPGSRFLAGTKASENKKRLARPCESRANMHRERNYTASTLRPPRWYGSAIPSRSSRRRKEREQKSSRHTRGLFLFYRASLFYPSPSPPPLPSGLLSFSSCAIIARINWLHDYRR